jgi:hypothetical protein
VLRPSRPIRACAPIAAALIVLALTGCGQKPDLDTHAAALAAVDCVSCHADRYLATTTPNHPQLGFPDRCEECHTTTSWQPAAFGDHAAFWPLEGQHTTTPCSSCHIDEVYAGTPRECEGCHLPDYQATTAPSHLSAGFPQTCQVCHTPAGWSPANFGEHDNYWPLVGQHAVAACASCHEGGVYAGTPKVCEQCHLPDYQATTAPAHASAGFPQTCESCHTPLGWQPANFTEHDAYYPLKGQHSREPCASCHIGGVFAGTPKECYACHQADYQGVAQPNHVTGGFPQTCDTCHGFEAWKPAAFTDHDAYWPLTGKHLEATCAQCHANGVYAGTPRTCEGCHLDTYQGTTNPNHPGAGIGQDCDTCHGTAGWQGASFPIHNTSFFPVSGDHSGFKCADCHKTGQWEDFTCTGCHEGEHIVSKMDNKHQGVSGYASKVAALGHDAACLDCHPDGKD